MKELIKLLGPQFRKYKTRGNDQSHTKYNNKYPFNLIKGLRIIIASIKECSPYDFLIQALYACTIKVDGRIIASKATSGHIAIKIPTKHTKHIVLVAQIHISITNLEIINGGINVILSERGG